MDAYKAHVSDALHKVVVLPLCRDIEKSLRLKVHAAQLPHMEAPNPRTEQMRSITRFLQLGNIRLFDSSIDLKREVCIYLEREFYELTVLALHDYRTYSSMRNLAKECFDLDIAGSHLPMGTLDQGLDVLQIVRNIHIFVARYKYNMNAQIFIERKPSRGAASQHDNTRALPTRYALMGSAC